MVISKARQETQANLLHIMQGGDKFPGHPLRPAQAAHLAEMAGMSKPAAVAALALLSDKGLVKRRGVGPYTMYQITAAGMAAEIK